VCASECTHATGALTCPYRPRSLERQRWRCCRDVSDAVLYRLARGLPQHHTAARSAAFSPNLLGSRRSPAGGEPRSCGGLPNRFPRIRIEQGVGSRARCFTERPHTERDERAGTRRANRRRHACVRHRHGGLAVRALGLACRHDTWRHQPPDRMLAAAPWMAILGSRLWQTAAGVTLAARSRAGALRDAGHVPPDGDPEPQRASPRTGAASRRSRQWASRCCAES